MLIAAEVCCCARFLDGLGSSAGAAGHLKEANDVPFAINNTNGHVLL
jgi:hypothetical protein